ncbi:DUF4169 family protein [Roseomonas sp. M0104]|uniref:DUF4169 family protein n=1 Tax=Teichococcus coralli TaxID=2545983 RepID=A0A845B7Y8_9PROT|nr:DUF4169 family protein [Pseudoroseomonas coralli]MXP62360.1 DUF4169 family protein [Pseudoroseomonas coralli]
MAEIVNLNQRRKAAARQAEARQATANRVKFGRSKAEKARDATVEAQRRALLDGARREAPPPPGEAPEKG